MKIKNRWKNKWKKISRDKIEKKRTNQEKY